MELLTSPSTPSLRTTADARPGRRRLRQGIAVVAVGGLLSGMVGFSAAASTTTTTATTTTTTASTVLTARGWGYGPGTQTYDPFGRSGSGSSSGSTQSSTIDSQAATSKQEQGVALVDTVLSGGEAAGTGIVLTSDGEVLTNYHVVEGSTSIRVTIASTGKAYTATVVGADPSADVALLQLKDASGLTTATIDDDTLTTGDDVTAIGNAGGTGTLTAADGTVTSLSATITTASEATVKGETLKQLIETTADVVPGDSGGPLVDSEGEVVGIDTAASSGTDIDGYAIPIATALTIVTEIQSGDETGGVRIGPAAFLGVQLASTSTSGSAYGDSLGGSNQDGAAVAGVVQGDAAADAGIAAGDTITAIGSTSVSSADDLSTAIAGYEPGDQVFVTWTTADGQTQTQTVTLGSSPVN